MSVLKSMRTTLATDLSVLGVPVYPEYPLRLDPPCVYFTVPIGGPYIATAREFGTFVVSLDVVVLVEHRPPDEGREALETLLESLLLNSMDWALLGVEPPATQTIEDYTYEFLGTVVHLSKAFHL